MIKRKEEEGLLIGLLLMFGMAFSGIFVQKYANQNYQIRNILTLSMTLSVAIFFVFQYFINYKTLTFITEKFTFLSDPFLYIALILNFSGQYISRKLVKSNEDNLSYIQFGNFLFIAFVPIVSFLAVEFFDFKNAINVNYDSFFDVLKFSSILIVLSFLLFFDKIKNKSLKRIDLMFYMLICTCFAFVFINKLMQTYNTEAVYFCSILFNAFMWFNMSFKKKEYSYVKKRHYKFFFIFALCYLMYSYFNIIIVEFLPVEHISILRTLAFITMASLFDFMNAKKLNLSLKDFVVLCILFLTLYMLSY